MVDPVVTPTALFWPHCCGVCQSQSGPFVDTSHETRLGDRTYLCASCVRLAALALGFLEGDRHTELLHVAEHESETAKQLVQMTERRDKLAAELREAKKQNAAVVADRDWNVQRVAQLEAAITDDARSRLAIVGGEAA